MEHVYRFDFNGSYKDFQRTPQGFLRVNARLTKTGVFSYDNGREYRSDEEVFRADSLASIKGAPVTDLHPSEKGSDSFLTPGNTKDHIIGITENVERDGIYLKGSLIIFHEDAIRAIENGERKEISLGYTCRLEPIPGSVNGEAYDAVQRDIVVNHVAIGPKGWGRAGSDCSIRTDAKPFHQPQGIFMKEIVRLDGVDIALTAESVSTLFTEQRRQQQEMAGRLDAVALELEKEKAARVALEDPQAIETKVQARLKLIEKCRHLLGDEVAIEGKTDEELKLLGIKKFHPDLDLAAKDQSYIDGMFEALLATNVGRNDSLAKTRHAIHHDHTSMANQAYETWIEQSAKLWQMPLTGSVQGGR